ncbi:hypothetical protein [Actinophytocola sp.]|uniref:hypothetical protein n=1 Tax=Actinophytocola sp. TaxID=1872138 RepID=UPI002D7F94CE|nr:hypothetical protein [Actinophytocola sp.]HET9138502.1 hypothetical protein [Actinophytocola sp.]
MATAPNRSESPRWQRHHAARVVAGAVRDAAELTELLAMLGLTAAEGRQPPVTVHGEQMPAPRHASPAERDLAATLLADVTDAIR